MLAQIQIFSEFFQHDIVVRLVQLVFAQFQNEEAGVNWFVANQVCILTLKRFR
jgi:hypothetical protein